MKVSCAIKTAKLPKGTTTQFNQKNENIDKGYMLGFDGYGTKNKNIDVSK